MIDVTAPGRALHQRFQSLGNMTGKTAADIIAHVGRPSSISSLAHGSLLMQWQATGCHMALVFDSSEHFVKISHQYASYRSEPAYVPYTSSYEEPDSSPSMAKIVGTILGVIFGLALVVRLFL